MKSKYVVFDNKLAVCFHKDIVHADVATMQHGSYEGDWDRKFPTSAGFFEINSELSYETEDGEHWPEGRVVTKVRAFGRSESLELESNPDDSILIKQALGLW